MIEWREIEPTEEGLIHMHEADAGEYTLVLGLDRHIWEGLHRQHWTVQVKTGRRTLFLFRDTFGTDREDIDIERIKRMAADRLLVTVADRRMKYGTKARNAAEKEGICRDIFNTVQEFNQ